MLDSSLTSSLEYLDIRGNPIDTGGAQALVDFVQRCTTLLEIDDMPLSWARDTEACLPIHLDLSDLRLAHHDFVVLAALIMASKRPLSSLRLAGNILGLSPKAKVGGAGDFGMAHLAPALHASALTVLDVSRTGLGHAGAEWLGKAISPRLRALHVAGNGLGEGSTHNGIKQLAPALWASNIEHLDITNNSVIYSALRILCGSHTPEGARPITRRLKVLHYQTPLDQTALGRSLSSLARQGNPRAALNAMGSAFATLARYDRDLEMGNLDVAMRQRLTSMRANRIKNTSAAFAALMGGSTTELNLSEVGLGDKGAEVLGGLSTTLGPSHGLVSGVGLVGITGRQGTADAYTAWAAVNAAQPLASLNLSHNAIGCDGLRGLLLMERTPGAVWRGAGSLNPAAAPEVTVEGNLCTSLTELDLSHNQLDDRALSYFFEHGSLLRVQGTAPAPTALYSGPVANEPEGGLGKLVLPELTCKIVILSRFVRCPSR